MAAEVLGLSTLLAGGEFGNPATVLRVALDEFIQATPMEELVRRAEAGLLRTNLVVLAIILWNTMYLERAINALRQHGIAFPDALLPHVSPIGWEHINLTGDYTWQSNRRVAQGRLRPLRPIGAPTTVNGAVS